MNQDSGIYKSYNIINMTEKVKNTIEEVLVRRFLNPVYFNFFLFSAILHWEFLYSVFFLDQEYIWEKECLLKNEYLYKHYILDWWFWTAFLMAGVMTYLTIWKFPNWFLIKADKEDNKYRKEKDIDRLTADIEIKEMLKKDVDLEKQIETGKEAVAKKKVSTAKAVKEV